MEAPENKNELIELFGKGPDILEKALEGLSDKELDFTPSKGGWTIRQIVHHLVDGDDIWKHCIKMALGNEEAEFSLKWYLAFPQMEWADNWKYEKRPLDTSLKLLRAMREHVLQLLNYVPDAWTKSARYLEPNGDIEIVPVGFAIQIQANHIVHHIKRITEVKEEMSAS